MSKPDFALMEKSKEVIRKMHEVRDSLIKLSPSDPVKYAPMIRQMDGIIALWEHRHENEVVPAVLDRR